MVMAAMPTTVPAGPVMPKILSGLSTMKNEATTTRNPVSGPDRQVDATGQHHHELGHATPGPARVSSWNTPAKLRSVR